MIALFSRADVTPAPVPSDPEVALSWLIRLRWMAMAGQTLTVLVAAFLFEARLPALALAATIAATLATNVALLLWTQLRRPVGPWLVPSVLTLDTLLLTLLLGLSGGPRNPFTSLYVVHVALAAVALRARWAWWMVGISALCYAVLFRVHLPLEFAEGAFAEPLHVSGIAASVILVAGVIATYTAGVAGALRAREGELRDAQARVARNERLASLAALAAGTAHELGTPLGTIAVAAKELERAASRLEGGEGVLEDAELIRSQVDRCRRILDRLSALDAEGHAPSREPLSLEAFVARVRGDQPSERAERLTLDVAGGESGARVDPDAALALAPLVQNAFDALGPGGEVTLRARLRQQGAGAGVWRFEVVDAGPGMTPEVARRASEPFFTTKEHGRGMGLGLYLARLIAERHEGALELSSRVGEGTTAALTLPAIPAGGAARRSLTRSSSGAEGA